MKHGTTGNSSAKRRLLAALVTLLGATVGALVLVQPAHASVNFASRNVRAGVGTDGTADCNVLNSGSGDGISGAVSAKSCVGSAITNYNETYSGTTLTGASGKATVDGDGAHQGVAEYDLFFTVTTDSVSFQASGNLSGVANQNLFLLEKPSSVDPATGAVTPGTIPFDLRPGGSTSGSGVLTPGSYRLEARAGGFFGAAEFFFTLGGATASVSIGDAVGLEGTAAGNTLTFPVTLSSAATSPVTVGYGTSDGSAHAGGCASFQSRIRTRCGLPFGRVGLVAH